MQGSGDDCSRQNAYPDVASVARVQLASRGRDSPNRSVVAAIAGVGMSRTANRTRGGRQMPRLPIPRRALSAAVTAILLAGLLPLAGVASAATPSTNCQSSEGTTCWLDLSAPSSVRTGFAFTVQVRVTTDASKTTVAKTDPCGSKAQIGLDVTGPRERRPDDHLHRHGERGDRHLQPHHRDRRRLLAGRAQPAVQRLRGRCPDGLRVHVLRLRRDLADGRLHPGRFPDRSMSPGHELRPGDEWQRYPGDLDRGARLRLGSEARGLLRARSARTGAPREDRSTPTASSGTRSRQLR